MPPFVARVGVKSGPEFWGYILKCPFNFDSESYFNFRCVGFLYISSLKIPLTFDMFKAPLNSDFKILFTNQFGTLLYISVFICTFNFDFEQSFTNRVYTFLYNSILKCHLTLYFWNLCQNSILGGTFKFDLTTHLSSKLLIY